MMKPTINEDEPPTTNELLVAWLLIVVVVGLTWFVACSGEGLVNDTARHVLRAEVERYVNFRKEKQEQIEDLERQLASAKEHLQMYHDRIAALQEALES